MGFYTLIVDYQGGTYVSQSDAETPDEGAQNCIKSWHMPDFGGEITEEMRREIVQALTTDRQQDMGFVALRGLQNIWYHSLEIRGALLEMNLVLTQSEGV